MLIKAQQSFVRQSPRKVRLVANAVRELSVPAAIKQLAVIERRSTEVVAKVLRQAIANATHNFGHQISDLEISNILVSEGPRYKRFQAVSRGRAHNLIKRSCHVTVELNTKSTEATAPMITANSTTLKSAAKTTADAAAAPTKAKSAPLQKRAAAAKSTKSAKSKTSTKQSES